MFCAVVLHYMGLGIRKVGATEVLVMLVDMKVICDFTGALIVHRHVTDFKTNNISYQIIQGSVKEIGSDVF